MAVELKSSFTPGRDLVTQLPGGQAPEAYPDLPPALLALLLARAKGPAQQAPVQRAARGFSEPPPRQTNAPTMGSSPAHKGGGGSDDVVTRVVPDPFASPWTKMQTGLEPGAKVERGFKDKDGNIQWEFDTVRPRGGSGGIIGGGAASTLHASENMGGGGPANPIEANRDDFDPVAGGRRIAPVPVPQSKSGQSGMVMPRRATIPRMVSTLGARA